jgi:quercetin dioxygenase-like cupin family protein
MKHLGIIAFAAIGASLLAQPPAGATKTLMKEPLGVTDGPDMSLYVLTVAADARIPSHSHKGPIFAYILEGDIENQVEPEQSKIYHPGDMFYEPAMHVHRVLRNLNTTKPAKLLLFHNTGTNANPLLKQPLASTTNQEVTVTLLRGAPAAPSGSTSSRPHQHPGPVFGYVLKGEVEIQVDPDPPKVYHAGDVFYEAPMHVHRMTRNLSATEPTEILVFQVGEKGQPLGLPVEEAGKQ